jgi:hypothetical protein
MVQHTGTSTLIVAALALLAGMAGATESIGSRHPVDAQQAEADMRAVDESIGSGKLYFTGTGYTVNLIPHAIVLGLLALGVVFLFGDSIFGDGGEDTSGYGVPAAYGAPEAAYGAPAPTYGAPAPSYGTPSTGYDAANRYYDTYAQQAATALGAGQ